MHIYRTLCGNGNMNMNRLSKVVYVWVSVNAATRADVVSQFEEKWLHPAELKPVPRVHAVWRVVPSSNIEARFQRYKLGVAQASEPACPDSPSCMVLLSCFVSCLV